ncbi:MAG: hypothetical protein EOM40_18555 [Clostridia bacterium]|nr:hypothetical protein [Clostridia bacterium]NCC44048.1 hypothetical protein [Clostridia bacterium]
MGKIETATQWMINLANDNSHGYDQANRWGPNYDCSSAVITAWQTAGVPVKTKGASSTSNMRSVFLANGFSEVISSVNTATGSGLKYGDVLHRNGHTAMFIGNGQIVHASINENGGITGGASGDQTGKEICIATYSNRTPWTSVLRYTAEGGGSVPINGQWVQAPDGRWWYRHSDGSYTKSNWEKIDGKWYYFDAAGWMMTGWVLVGGKWYFLESSGAMAENKWIENLYYVGSDGAMLTNKMTPDGYIVGSDGKWDGRDSWVKRLQTALKSAGYNPGTIDGVAGPATLAACPTLRSGSTGTLVTLLQERLYYYFGKSTNGIDGSFGNGTNSAVISFQRDRGITADGVVGQNTWSELLGL